MADPFEALVSEHYDSLYRFALSLTRAEADAQDLTQQAFYIWATKGHQLRDRSKVKTWLFTTLHRAHLMNRRRHDHFPHCELEESSCELPVTSFEFNHLDSSSVLSALAKVDEVFQAAVALFYLEDYRYKDIAEILGVPIGTVKSRIARGVAQLRDILSVEVGNAETGVCAAELEAARRERPRQAGPARPQSKMACNAAPAWL